MHGKNLIKKFKLADDELSRLSSEALGTATRAELDTAIGKTVAELAPNKIVKGKVIKVMKDDDERRLYRACFLSICIERSYN
jgi:hypothetical protein